MNPAHRFYPLAALRVLGWTTVVALFALVVLALSGSGNYELARIDRARLDLANLKGAVRIFVAKTGRLPTDMHELVTARILDSEPRDPWDQPYRYCVLAEEAVFLSLGADRASGGAEQAADIASSDLFLGDCEWRDR